MSEPEDFPEEIWDAAARCVPAYVSKKIIADIARAILAAKADERARVRDAVVGHIMTVVESLMEGRMTDAGLTKKDHIEMQAQIEALDVVADEIQALTFSVNTAHKNSVEA